MFGIPENLNSLGPTVFTIGSGYYPDAKTFCQVAGINNSKLISALSILVSDYKAASIWQKKLAIYPFIGGTEFTHKLNLKDPRDLDIANRLVFNNPSGFTHNEFGILPSGLNTYANTFCIPSLNLISGNSHISFYSRTNKLESSYEMGCDNTAGSSPLNILVTRYSNNRFSFGMASATAVANSNSTGYFMVNHQGSNLTAWRNGVKLSSFTSIGVYSPNQMVLFGRNRNGSFGELSTKQCAFASIGIESLTDQEAFWENLIVQNFQKNLGRAI